MRFYCIACKIELSDKNVSRTKECDRHLHIHKNDIEHWQQEGMHTIPVYTVIPLDTYTTDEVYNVLRGLTMELLGARGKKREIILKDIIQTATKESK